MPALSFSNWNLSSVTLASTKSKSQRNKLRRRRRPPPLRDMSGDANGVHKNADEVIPPMPTPVTASSATARSTSPTLHEKYTSEPPRERDADKDDAQAQVISSLRAQITDLITQVSQLNSKLVKSYDRVSDLEDELHIASQNVRTSSLKISNLEIERAQHLAALNTGLYVEKAHVTAELTRLMERATEEAAARGQAESARQNIEKDLDDLSASLFAQANTMVAEARLGRAMSERKVVEAEMALKGTEEAVGVMQQQMQALRDEKNRTDEEISRLRILMEKGKFVEHPPMVGTISVKLLSSNVPYQEFLQFVVHLRSMRHSMITLPHISTLLPLPFLARLQAEDSDPTVRLDLAPSLNWLSRRSVVSAIHCGQLTIEPMSVTTLMNESMSGLQSMIGSQPGIACALCGTHIYPPKSSAPTAPPPSHPLSSLSLGRHTSSGAWSSSIFKNPLSSAAPSPPPTPPREVSTPATPTNSNINLTTVYVFRLAQTPMQGPHPPSSYAPTQHTQSQKPTSYPLCASGWCLARLRTTCSLWAFVRAGVVDRVWEEDPVPRAAPSISSASSYSLISNRSTPTLADTNGAQKESAPPLPPRRRSKIASVGALWEKASGALRSATPTQSQPASPITNGDKENEEPSMPSPRGVLGQTKASTPASEPLKVTVPPTLPRRNHYRRVSEQDIADDKKPKEDEEEHGEDNKSSSIGSSSPTEAARSINEGTPVTRSRAASPTLRPTLPAQRITIANSQASSAFGEEFSTPIEEIGSFPPSVSPPASATDTPVRPSTPHSPRSVRSSARNSMSPPRSPGFRSQRISSPPPPHSPRSIPLPDSRPGTPVSPRGAHARRESGNVTPLNIDPEKLSRPPSRAASPRPAAVLGAASSPPPVPRRAAARRTVPPPPSAQQATPPSSGSNDEKEVPSYSSTSEEMSSGKEIETTPRTERRSIPPPPRRNEDSVTTEKGAMTTPKKEEKYVPLPPPRRSVDAPRLPPRRPGHIANNKSVTDFGNKDDERMDSTQDRLKSDKQNGVDRSELDDPKNYVGDATWEERTWKEIVRLREDMFWARVGAIRG
ncbi:hypothetical protein ACEPAH_1569 [Sanghuangporus vaninii]